MLLKIYGNYVWQSLHYISFGYPDNPTEEDKKNYLDFFKLIGNVFPCKKCRDSYNIYAKFDDEKMFENRENFTYWLYNLHNFINKKNGVYYDISFEDLKNKYLNNENLYFVPRIFNDNAQCFIEYSKLIDFDIESLFKYINKLKKYSEKWLNTNKIAFFIYNKIKNKEFISMKDGYPTKYELLLIGLNYTSLNIFEINKFKEIFYK